MKVLRKLGGIAVGVALGMASALSHAAFEIAPSAVTVTANPVALVTPVAGAQAITTLTFEFLENYSFGSLSLYVDYDKDFLKFNRAASTVGVLGAGPAVPLADAVAFLTTGMPGFDVESDVPSAGQYSLSGFTIEPFYPLPLGTKLVLTGVFDLKDSFTANTTAWVHMSGLVSGPSADPFREDSFGILQTTVTAVPEPETWMMLLGGLGLIAGSMRRRSAARADNQGLPA